MVNFFNEFLDRNNLKKVEVADYLGISKQSVSMMSTGAQKVSDKTLSRLRQHPSWDVSMLPVVDEVRSSTPSRRDAGKVKQLRILPIEAAAGYLNDNNRAELFSQSDYIEFVDFMRVNADFAIRVSGDSMYPRYNNGDVLACRILTDRNLLEWGKVYCINTVNGCIIKKLFPKSGDPDKVVCRSENKAYDDIELCKLDILGCAVVVGHAGLE